MNRELSANTGVVIVQYGPPEDLADCLAALRSAGIDPTRTYIVDNGPLTLESHAHGGAKVLSQSENLGFAEGANVGIRAALDDGLQGVLVLNPDARVHRTAVQILATTLDQHDDIGIVGAVTCDAEGTPNFAGATLDFARGKPRIRTSDWPHEGDALYNTEFVTGCALMIRAQAFIATGGFDPAYFLYWEDVDLAFRAREKGFRTVMVPTARITHLVAQTTGRSSPLTVYYQTRNRLLFFGRQTSNPIRRMWLKSRLTLSRLFRGTSKRLRGASDEGRAYLAGVADYYAGRFGRRDDFH